MQPTLLIMAAGMGSRYGGLKQLDGVGPHGEVIMDYSIYDALRAGFGKVVFVVRRSFEKEFDKFTRRYGEKVRYEIVQQEIEYVPAGYSYTPERVKPWGTNHAIMMAAPVIHEPFAAINADDYYGVDSFRVMADYLSTGAYVQNRYCMVGFQVGNTLSETGGVTRGVCEVNSANELTGVVERFQIRRTNGQIYYSDENDHAVAIPDDTPVSMNMWGFTPDYFTHSEQLFKEFLQATGHNPKSEFFIPYAVNELIQRGIASVHVLSTSSQWFGITYKEDRPTVVQRLRQLHNDGTYPEQLFYNQ
ncbi:MAG: nucleotidyltransferase [Prevotellaceae bacterium]|jgi:UTP-glucose-1-phosphate uridylyltransferase|nr:nucleotidyltransferase [Prevotellaceae bacterium]